MHPQQLIFLPYRCISVIDLSDTPLIVALVLLLIMSAFFSAAETAYSSCNKIRLKSLEQQGNKRAKRVLRHLEHYDRVISTVLVGNNIVNITMASLATVFFVKIISDNNLAVTLSTVVMTVTVLIFGEITPKILAKEHAEGFVCTVSPLVAFIMVILYPINWLFSMWKKLMNKVFKKKGERPYTEDELLTIVETAHSEGGINEHESRLIRSAIEFEDLDVDDVMIPRVDVAAVDETASIEKIADEFVATGFSRLPVYGKTIDSIVGVLHEKDFYQLMRDGGKDIHEKLTSFVCVPLNMKISKALRLLQKSKVHMAIVVDEFGGTAGIVTLEDILEELVGEIWDEHDEIEILYRKIDDNTFLIQGTENLEDMFEELGVETREEFDSTSVGGWVTEQMQKIPSAGEKFTFENLDITVTKANMKRVSEIKVKVLEKKQEEEEEKTILQKVIKKVEEIQS